MQIYVKFLSKILKTNITFNKIRRSPANRPTKRDEPKNLKQDLSKRILMVAFHPNSQHIVNHHLLNI